MIEIVIAGIVISSMVAVGSSWVLSQRLTNRIFVRLEEINSMAEKGILDMREQLDPIVKRNSQVMGVVSSMGAEVRQEKHAMELLGTDILDTYSSELGAVEMAFPNFAAYLRDNPQLVHKLIPRVRALLGDEAALESLGIPSPSGGRPHPFLREE